MLEASNVLRVVWNSTGVDGGGGGGYGDILAFASQ